MAYYGQLEYDGNGEDNANNRELYYVVDTTNDYQ